MWIHIHTVHEERKLFLMSQCMNFPLGWAPCLPWCVCSNARQGSAASGRSPLCSLSSGSVFLSIFCLLHEALHWHGVFLMLGQLVRKSSEVFTCFLKVKIALKQQQGGWEELRCNRKRRKGGVPLEQWYYAWPTAGVRPGGQGEETTHRKSAWLLAFPYIFFFFHSRVPLLFLCLMILDH